MNSTRFDGWPAAVCSCVTLLNIMPLSFAPSLSNDMGAGIPEPPVAAQLHITSLWASVDLPSSTFSSPNEPLNTARGC